VFAPVYTHEFVRDALTFAFIVRRWCDESNEFCEKRATYRKHMGTGGWYYDRGDHGDAIFREGCPDGK
jgi:hypothetical protein